MTLDYVSSQAWRISDLVATGKLDDAKALIGKLSDVIASVETGKAAGGGEEKTMGTEKAATVKAETTFEQFHTWSIAQLAKASTEEPEAALARLTHLAKVAKNFEQKGAGDKGAIDVEYETAFVGDGLPGKASDLTTKSDQDVDDGKIENQDTTGDKASSDVPFAKAIADAVDAIEKKVATAKSDSGLPKGAETAADGFVWPMDMSVDEADAKAAAERIEKAETPRASEDDWGRDPWSV